MDETTDYKNHNNANSDKRPPLIARQTVYRAVKYRSIKSTKNIVFHSERYDLNVGIGDS